VILILSVSPRIVGFGKLALGAVLVEDVRACAKETTGKTEGAGGGITLATLEAIAREDISACQSNMAAVIGSRILNRAKTNDVALKPALTTVHRNSIWR